MTKRSFSRGAIFFFGSFALVRAALIFYDAEYPIDALCAAIAVLGIAAILIFLERLLR